MKKITFLTTLFFGSIVAFAQCPPGDIGMATQEQINQFAIDYPNCTQMAGILQIGGSTTDAPGTITDLSPLGNLTQVGGLFIQNNGLLQNLNGLNITTVTGRLYIGGDNATNTNQQLLNVDGLSSLTSVGLFLQVLYNPLLTNLNGLSNITSVGQDIEITGNTLLTDISGLDGTTFNPNDGYGLTIINNPALAVCNLPNFCTYLSNPAGAYPRSISGNLAECINEVAVAEACGISLCPPGNVVLTTQAEVSQFIIDYPYCTEIVGNLDIHGNDITNLAPLNNIVSTGGELAIWNCSTLQSVNGLTALTQIGDRLFIGGDETENANTLLENLNGLSSLATVGGSVFIQYNSALANIDALSNLTSVGAALVIFNNAALTNLNGLTSVTSIGSFFSIDGNSVLADISGIANISEDTIPELYIQNNPLLQVCNLPNVCEYLQTSKPRNIANNAGDCVTEAAVTAACTAGIEDFESTTITAYPNPVERVLTLSSDNEISSLTIVNMLGQTVLSTTAKSADVHIDLGALAAGNYFVKAVTGQTVKTIKIVKQ